MWCLDDDSFTVPWSHSGEHLKQDASVLEVKKKQLQLYSTFQWHRSDYVTSEPQQVGGGGRNRYRRLKK